jgi:hypothetical protein
MKKILTIAILMISLSLSAQRNYESETNKGALLLIGGTAFNIAGFLTPTNYTNVYVGNTNVMTKKQTPIIGQIKTYCFITGVTITITGLFSIKK